MTKKLLFNLNAWKGITEKFPESVGLFFMGVVYALIVAVLSKVLVGTSEEYEGMFTTFLFVGFLLFDVLLFVPEWADNKIGPVFSNLGYAITLWLLDNFQFALKVFLGLFVGYFIMALLFILVLYMVPVNPPNNQKLTS